MSNFIPEHFWRLNVFFVLGTVYRMVGRSGNILYKVKIKTFLSDAKSTIGHPLLHSKLQKVC